MDYHGSAHRFIHLTRHPLKAEAYTSRDDKLANNRDAQRNGFYKNVHLKPASPLYPELMEKG